MLIEKTGVQESNLLKNLCPGFYGNDGRRPFVIFTAPSVLFSIKYNNINVPGCRDGKKKGG